ncbi:hypothetical protein DMH04_33570 [Kibdelosporangium aridum]|uniref:Uncharacterized protein n=1 Tax=Kibdelosporangium aridum TaxID=2030 RepID=A0A428Z164_KIBAR|nr:hypothetical protein [Kibdelosporangium aridum]RSM78588.1 hypothetical protein DMH04_33570 [Kibdelosporangium aridum]
MTLEQTAGGKHGVGVRCAIAAGIGAGLGLAYVGLIALITSEGFLGDGLARLGWLIILTPLALAFCVTVAWPLLSAAKVERAWQVALLGPVAFWAWWEFLSGVEVLVLYKPVFFGAAGYAAAALVTSPRLPSWGRIAVAAGVVALFLFRPVVVTDTAESWDWWEEDELRAYARPLLAPDLPDYRIQAASAGNELTPRVYYRLRPRSADRNVSPSVVIKVMHQLTPADFDPPADCDLMGSRVPEPCTVVAPDVWRTARGTYLARKGSQIVEFQPGASVPENDLLRAATTLRVVPVEHFEPIG